MADWETTRRQLVQLLLGGVDPSIVEQGVTHPMDPSASPPEILPAREKRSFVDMAMGGEYADRPIPTHALAALNKGWDPQTAMGIQQGANLIEQVMEAKVAQGSRSKALPGGRKKAKIIDDGDAASIAKMSDAALQRTLNRMITESPSKERVRAELVRRGVIPEKRD